MPPEPYVASPVVQILAKLRTANVDGKVELRRLRQALARMIVGVLGPNHRPISPCRRCCPTMERERFPFYSNYDRGSSSHTSER